MSSLWNISVNTARRLKSVAVSRDHRDGYGETEFAGDPLPKLYETLLDALNYIDEYKRQEPYDSKDLLTHKAAVFDSAELVRKKLAKRHG